MSTFDYSSSDQIVPSICDCVLKELPQPIHYTIIREMSPLIWDKNEDQLLNILEKYKDHIRYLPAYEMNLYNCYDSLLNNALIHECYRFSERLIEYVDMKQCNEIGCGPIKSLLLKYSSERYHTITLLIERLIAKGADINAVGNSNGCNALHYAVTFYDRPLVQFLCEHGADIHNQYRNQTILEVAIHRDDSEIINYLQSLSGYLTKSARR